MERMEIGWKTYNHAAAHLAGNIPPTPTHHVQLPLVGLDLFHPDDRPPSVLRFQLALLHDNLVLVVVDGVQGAVVLDRTEQCGIGYTSASALHLPNLMDRDLLTILALPLPAHHPPIHSQPAHTSDRLAEHPCILRPLLGYVKVIIRR
jgi:hypothetical protein